MLYQDGKSFHATALKQLFIGKSVNNSSFLGAVLVDQQVIRPHPQTARLLEVNEDYELWFIGLESHLKTESDVDLEAHQDEITTEIKAAKKRQNKTAEKITTAVSTEEDVDEIHQE